MRLRLVSALLSLLCALALPAMAFDVTATMPLTSGSPIGCQLYLDGVQVLGVHPCGTPVEFQDVITDEGTYEFRYLLVKPGGAMTALSPATTVVITEDVANPTSPPTISLACDPSPCPATITITISP